MIAELSQRRVFRVISGYAVVCFVILQIADVAFEPLGIGDDVLRIVIAAMLLALPLVAYLSWIFDVDPESSLQRTKSGKPWLEASITFVALAGLAVGAWFVLRPATTDLVASEVQAPLEVTDKNSSEKIATSIAVLPFTNLSDDTNQEYFSDGITEDIINGLARNTSLVVRPRSSSFALKGQNLDLQAIGQRLDVTHVLEGSVRRSGERVRVTLQLSEVASNQSIWSDRHEGELTDIFTVQDTIARNVVNTLKAEFVRVAQPNQFPGTEAYDAFLLARYQFERFNLPEALRLFKIATDLDPANADAWSARARTISVLNTGSYAPNSGEYRQSRVEYIDRALAIDPTHPNALGLKAWWAFVEDHEYQSSIDTLVKLTHGNPNNAIVPLYLSMFLNVLGQNSLALQVHAKYEELDPIGSQYSQVEVSLFADELAEARQRFQKYFGENPDALEQYSHLAFQLALAERDIDTMQKFLGTNRTPTSPMYSVRKALVQILQGNQKLGEETLATWADSAKYKALYVQSRAALIVGDIETAVSYWREGLRNGEPAIAIDFGRHAWGKAFPEFYAHPDYQAMLVEFGLDAESISKITLPQVPF